MLVWEASYKVLRLIPILWSFTNTRHKARHCQHQSQPGEQVRKRCPTTACFPLPGISWYFQLWSSTHIQWSKVDRYISGRNSIRSNSNSFLPPILIICHRHSLTKLILITQLTQLTQLTVTHSTHPDHSTHQTHQTHQTRPTHPNH